MSGGNTGARPGGRDGTYGTNRTYMTLISPICPIGPIRDTSLGARHQHDVGTPWVSFTA